VGVKGRQWSQISHRKLNISIWVPSMYVNPPKDLLLRFVALLLLPNLLLSDIYLGFSYSTEVGHYIDMATGYLIVVE
jgi:hypothetical protein